MLRPASPHQNAAAPAGPSTRPCAERSTKGQRIGRTVVSRIACRTRRLRTRSALRARDAGSTTRVCQTARSTARRASPWRRALREDRVDGAGRRPQVSGNEAPTSSGAEWGEVSQKSGRPSRGGATERSTVIYTAAAWASACAARGDYLGVVLRRWVPSAAVVTASRFSRPKPPCWMK